MKKNMERAIFWTAFSCLIAVTQTAWQDNIKPKSILKLGDEDLVKFSGNETFDDNFKIVLVDSNSLLVGARNVIYNLSLSDLTEQSKVEWFPKSEQMNDCYMKGGSSEACQNYIRILVKKSPTEYLFCGTNAFWPMCHEYKLSANGHLVFEEAISGRGLCPYDPRFNTTAVYADGQLYVGTIADFSGQEPLIYRDPLTTERYDSYTLNSPNFVSAFALGDFVYFFFREVAVEYFNCGKKLYSRVARVCRHDKGGPQKQNLNNKWTSYSKSRLNCSISGEYPFYFDDIQATTDPVEGRYGGHATTLLYGVFTTPENSIPGSAICAFTFQDIMDTFEGPFKGRKDPNDNWLPVPPEKVPEPRPGQCAKDSSTLPDSTLNFIKSHPLMDEAVPAFFGHPLFIRSSHYSSGRFTSITVDPQVRTLDGKNYDILFVGTDEGKIFKTINTKSADSFQDVEPFVIEEITVFPPDIAVTSLKIVNLPHGRRLLVISSTKIVNIPLHRCSTRRTNTCRECVALQDPYCAWDPAAKKCRVAFSTPDLIQNVAEGVHHNCSKADPSHEPSVDTIYGSKSKGTARSEAPYTPNEISEAGDEADMPISQSIPLQYTAETLAIAVASAAIGALILGFITGFFCGKKCNKEEENQLYAVTDYEYYDQRQNANSRLTSDMQEEVTYAEPVLIPQSLNKPVNLVLNMSPKATLKSNHPANQNLSTMGNISNMGLGGTMGQPMAPNLAMPPQGPTGGPQDIPLHYTPESYSTHGTLRSSEKYGTRGRDHRRDYDHRLGDGYSTTRSVKKVYL